MFSVIWRGETVPKQWREGLIVNLSRKGDREDPGNYRGITLHSVVGKVFCKILNNQCLDKGGALHEGQAGFRVNRSCMDNVYTFNEIVKGRFRGDLCREGNKSQVDPLKSIILGGAKRILGCSCNEAVRGDMGLETLKSRSDRSKLKWWYKLATMPEDRFPKQLFSLEWDQKPRRGRQRKTWGRVIDDLFVSLGLDKAEWLEDIERGEISLASYLACIDECISERECRKFEEGLDNSKIGYA